MCPRSTLKPFVLRLMLIELITEGECGLNEERTALYAEKRIQIKMKHFSRPFSLFLAGQCVQNEVAYTSTRFPIIQCTWSVIACIGLRIFKCEKKSNLLMIMSCHIVQFARIQVILSKIFAATLIRREQHEWNLFKESIYICYLKLLNILYWADDIFPVLHELCWIHNMDPLQFLTNKL